MQKLVGRRAGVHGREKLACMIRIRPVRAGPMREELLNVQEASVAVVIEQRLAVRATTLACKVLLDMLIGGAVPDWSKVGEADKVWAVAS